MQPISMKLITLSKQPGGRDLRFRRSFRFFAAKGYIRTPINFLLPYKGILTVEDVLWTGENIDPLFFEMLPAAAVRFPGHFAANSTWPEDLLEVVENLRAGHIKGPSFRGRDYGRIKDWLELQPRDRRSQELRGRTVSFRMSGGAIRQLEEYARRHRISRTEAVHRAIERLAKS